MQTKPILLSLVAIFLLIGLLQLGACTYENELDLYGTTTCDTTSLSYKTDIQPILATNCYACHAATSSVTNKPMDSYAAIKPYIQNGALLNSIKGTGGYDIMPTSGPMSNCNISKVESWIQAGFPDN